MSPTNTIQYYSQTTVPYIFCPKYQTMVSILEVLKGKNLRIKKLVHTHTHKQGQLFQLLAPKLEMRSTVAGKSLAYFLLIFFVAHLQGGQFWNWSILYM